MRKNNSSSGVSIAINNTLNTFQKNLPLITPDDAKEFTIKIANSLQEREAVFRLGYEVYLNKGFIKPNPQEWLIQQYDADPESIILIVLDKLKNIVGSVTLVFDENLKLPAEKIYGSEVNYLKSNYEKIAELSRLIIDPAFRNSKEILVLLFNYLCIYIQYVKKYNCLIIEVNPRHKDFYKKTLSFDEIGREKPCPQVQDAPAVLLYMPTSRYQAQVKRFGDFQNTNAKERSFFQYFLKPEQELLVAYYLAKQVKPMSEEEKLYFGFSESNNLMAVAI